MACTLACDEGHITAHKDVLCDHSEYLQDILSKYPDAEHPIIILTEPNLKDIKILVNYMYTGELVITNDSSTTSLLRAAQILKIDLLTANSNSNTNHSNHSSSNNNNNHSNNNNHNNSINHHHHSNSNNNNNNNNNHNNSINSNSITDYINSLIDFSQNSGNNDDNIDDDNNDDDEKSDIDLQRHHHPQQDSIDLQLQTLNDNKNNKIRCHLCNIGLSDVKCLYRHVLTRHLPEKWGYKCEFCDREFSRDDHLMRHYTTKHKNMEFDREKIRETRRLNREMAKNFHDQIQM